MNLETYPEVDNERIDNYEVREASNSYACGDCDYRWVSNYEGEEKFRDLQYCPMCGSTDSIQI